jgi:diacylglycerol kinase family enzyme
VPAAIPAFVNPKSGSADDALAAIRADPRFDARPTEPSEIATKVREEAARGTPRVLVSGGDGTVAQAAGAAAEGGIELAVLPGGTLNHFARDFGLPLDDRAAALDLAATGTARPVDLAYLDDRVMLNTSSVGAYVNFVRTRERLERWLGYHLASLVAAIRVWFNVRGFVVAFRASDGTTRRYVTPLVFIGVGERVLDRAGLGSRVPNGAAALHVLVVREKTRARVAALAFGALVRGLDAIVKTDALDAYLVDECTVTMRRPWGNVSIDGEIARLRAPLTYRLARGAVRVVGAPVDDGR